MPHRRRIEGSIWGGCVRGWLQDEMRTLETELYAVHRWVELFILIMFIFFLFPLWIAGLDTARGNLGQIGG